MLSFNEKLNMLRAGVLGANDGIVSIAGVVIGVAAATQNVWTILISSFAAILAGAFSMAGGEYVSVSTQKDTEESVTKREKRIYEQSPELIEQELHAYYVGTMGDVALASELAQKAMANNPIQHLIKLKYNIEADGFTNPFQAALASFIAFILGAIPPVMAIIFMPDAIKIPGTVAFVSFALILTGFISAKLGNAPITKAIIRNVSVGLLTMFATYTIGYIFGIQM